MVSLRIGLKGILYRRRRYAVIAAALSIAFAAMLLLSGLTAAMEQNLHDRALRRYGGELFILGQRQVPRGVPLITNDHALHAAIKAAGIHPALVARRTDYYQYGMVFFDGYAARQKVVSGLDWRVEAPVFRGMDFVAGSDHGMAGSKGILVSTVTAKELGVKVGDDVVLEATTIGGSRNTVNLVVKGIFRDSSIFGAYTSYVDRAVLNRLIGLKPDQYTILGIYLKKPGAAAVDSKRLYAALAKRVPVFGYVRTEQELWTEFAKPWKGVKYAVLTLNGYLSEVRDVTNAVRLGRDLLLAMMLVIVLIGIGNTYSVVIHDRTRELGTLRAIGMQRPALTGLVVSEALVLGLFGVAAGSALGFGALVIVGNLPVPTIPGFDIFLSNGRLGWVVSPATFVLEAATIVMAALLGGLRPAMRAGAVEPADALRAIG